MHINYYTILGIEDGATIDEIKSAYRKLAVRWHPDKHQNDAPADKAYAEHMFKMINEAYHAILDGRTGEGNFENTQAYSHQDQDTSQDCNNDNSAYNRGGFDDSSSEKHQYGNSSSLNPALFDILCGVSGILMTILRIALWGTAIVLVFLFLKMVIKILWKIVLIALPIALIGFLIYLAIDYFVI